MKTETKIIVLNRDCMALLVPSGARIMLHRGTEVSITQSLGNSVTVSVYGNLARIAGKDVDALGQTPVDPLADLPEGTSIQDKVWYQLKTVFDPEIPVNIVDLGLIYRCDVTPVEKDAEHVNVHIDMTLTAPGCGMGPVIAADAKQSILTIPQVDRVNIEIVFDPPWDQSMMTDLAKLELGML